MKYLTAEDLFTLLYELKEAFDFRLSSINSNPSLNLYFYAGESEN